MGKKLEIRVGDKFGRWTVVQEVEPKIYTSGKRRSVYRQFLVRCECGKAAHVLLTDLALGRSRMCRSCSQTKHGKLQHPLYLAISHAIQRCHNTQDVAYADYGGRGIQVCDEWRYNKGAFVSWGLENGWKDGLELDREDNNGNYAPENCRFVDRRTNLNNRRCTLRTADGASLAELYNKEAHPAVTYSCFAKRIKAGWDVSVALTKRSRKHGGL